MIRLSINLPTEHRLDLSLVKRRKSLDDKPLLPRLGDIRRVRKGNKFSRIFRHIFEHKKIKKVLGANIAFLVIASTFLPHNSSEPWESDNQVITKAPIVLTTEKSTRYPVNEVKITQGYKIYHPGIDFDGIYGDPIYPILNGTVDAISYSSVGYGNAVLINHGNEITSLYAHLSQVFVSEGGNVSTNRAIGAVGESGFTSGDHLHLEVRDHGYPINPLSVLPSQ